MTTQFDVRSSGYLENFSGFHNHFSWEVFDLFLQRIFQIYQKPLWVCDHMAGAGAVSKYLQEHYSEKLDRLVAVDASDKLLDVLQGVDEKIVADVQALPLQDNTFDLVISRLGLNNLENPVAYRNALVEIFRTLQEGGLLLVQDHFGLSAIQNEAINTLENHVAHLEGRTDSSYCTSLKEFLNIALGIKGFELQFLDSFECWFNISDRFRVKKLDTALLDSDLFFLKNFIYEWRDRDLYILGPVVTLVLKKFPLVID